MNYEKLSRKMSHALRHKPSDYNITLDANGWTNIEDLLLGIKSYKGPLNLTDINDIYLVVETQTKKRFEINGNLIRCVNGHSVEGSVAYESSVPPDILYHGTAKQTLQAIRASGCLKSMRRQYVHFSVDFATAIRVGSRHGTPHVLTVRALEAHKCEIPFYKVTDALWLCKALPIEFTYSTGAK